MHPNKLFEYHIIHISYTLHSLDCNFTDREYVLIPEEGAEQEEAQDLAPKPAAEDLPAAPTPKGKPWF
jgi:hypothetical protein